MNVRVSGVILENDTVLLIRHDYGEEQLWHIPGGNVKDYETLSEALKREFLEELGLLVEVGALWLVCDSIRPDGVHVLHCIFVVERLEREPVVQKEETSGVEYVWMPVIKVLSNHLYPSIAVQLTQLAADYPESPPAQYIGHCQPVV